jgi:hypothetical protein
MAMSKDDDMTDEQQLAQNHPPSWSSIFGEDDGPSMFDEASPVAPPNSSAVKMASRRQRRDREAQQERDLAVIQRAAEVDADEQALAKAIRLRDAGKKVPADLRIRAARAARNRGTPMSSAELLSMQAGRGR